MNVARELDRERGVVLKYSTSGDITDDNTSVVGYSSVRFI
jgi:AmmeMemoRadiSam system protein B